MVADRCVFLEAASFQEDMSIGGGVDVPQDSR